LAALCANAPPPPLTHVNPRACQSPGIDPFKGDIHAERQSRIVTGVASGIGQTSRADREAAGRAAAGQVSVESASSFQRPACQTSVWASAGSMQSRCRHPLFTRSNQLMRRHDRLDCLGRCFDEPR